MEDKIIALKNYKNLANANLDSAVLKENGIESFVGNQQVVELYPMFQDIDQGLKVYVFEKDYTKALKLLEEYHSADAN
jgi:hypothetical protein